MIRSLINIMIHYITIVDQHYDSFIGYMKHQFVNIQLESSRISWNLHFSVTHKCYKQLLLRRWY